MVSNVWPLIGITGWQVLAVTFAATVLFWAFTLFMAFFGQRMRARVTIPELAMLTVLGSVMARSMLGPSPTMTAGLIILVVLIIWVAVLGLLSRHLPRRLVPTREARVVLRDGVVDRTALTRIRMREHDLMVRLRRAGIRQLSEVSLAIVERDGSITVIRQGQTIDPALLAGVEV